MARAGERDSDLIVAQWPMADATALDPEAAREIDWLIRLVSEVRAARDRTQRAAGRAPAAACARCRATTAARLRRQQPAIARLARVDSAVGDAPAGAAAQIVVDEATFVLPLEGVIDIEAERTRLAKGKRGGREGARRPRRAPQQSELRRARQARGGGEGARRPCRQGRRGRAAGRGVGASRVIERLRNDEIPAAISLWEAAGLAHPWNDSARDIELALGCPTATILAAHDEAGALVGTVMAGFDGHRGWLYSLAVADSQRGKGVGGELVRTAEEWLKGQGAPVIRLMVRADNEGVGAFYKFVGYERGEFLVFGKRL